MDRTIVFGRTLRELVLLAIGVGFTGFATYNGDDPANLCVYAVATLLFALRFFPARAAAVAVAFAALAQRWPPSLYHRALLGIDWTAYLPLVVLPLLASRDLCERFDRAPSRLRWLPNFWTRVPEKEARTLRACAYALAAVNATLWQAVRFEVDGGSIALVLAVDLCLVVLALGRAVILLAIPPLGLVVLYEASRSPVFRATPEYVLPTQLCAALAALIALPFAFRLLRLLLR